MNAYFADELNLSAKYFGDLVKKETGKTAQKYMQFKFIDLANEKIFDGDKTVHELRSTFIFDLVLVSPGD